jgi:hypothetical protein
MSRDIFGRHCPVRKAGSQVGKTVTEDVIFLLNYKSSASADFSVTLNFEEGDVCFVLLSLRLSFCVACGRFIGFGSLFDVCWICEEELE